MATFWSTRRGARLARSGPAIAVLALLVAVAIGPEAAAAATSTGPAQWSAVPADGATVLEARPTITATAFDATGIKNSGFWLVLDGAIVSARFQWKIVGYNGTVPVYDKRYATLTFTPKSDLTNANHALRANVSNIRNQASAYYWAFTRSAAPQLFGPQPAPASIVTSRSPELTVRVTGVTAGLVGSFVVDGVAVPGVYSATTGLLTGVPSAPLETDTSHDVTATVTVLGGASARLGWSFTVQLRPPMPVVSTCTACHAKADHPMTNCVGCHGPDAPLGESEDITGPPHPTGYLVEPEWTCAGCHTGTYVGPPGTHPFSPDTYHRSAVSDACTDCHSRSLSVEHSRPGYDCLTCHSSTRSDVRAAIAGGDTSCGACHGDAGGHEAQHEITSNPCASCHPGTSLTTIHLSGGTTTCDSCHESTNPNVIAAIDSGTKDCSACHTAEGLDYHTNLAAAHLSPTTSSCFGVGCHDASQDLRTIHDFYVGTGAEFSQYATSCDLCHANEDPDRIDWSQATATCTGVCHSGAPHTQMPAKHAPTAASSECTSCHGTDLNATHGTYTDLTKCAYCHADKGNWAKTGDCAECHSGVDHETMHQTTLASDCASCHQPILTSEHARTSSSSAAGGCDSCHPNPAASAKPWGGSCVQGGCHVAGTPTAQHAQIESKHATATPTPPCFGSGCHAGSLTELHSQASTTVAGVTRTGCNVCHTSTAVPTTTDCATCHPERLQPHGYEPADHRSDVGGTLLTGTYADGGTYSFRCDACHLTELSPEHVRTTSSSKDAACGNCHPTLVDQLVPSWAKGCVQAGCHPSGSADSSQHGKMAVGHTLAPANATCAAAGCHDGGDLAAVHKGTTGQCAACHSTSGVPTTHVCEDCHGQPHGDLDAAHTANETGGLTWPNTGAYAACTQCHYLDVRTEHAKGSSGSLGCQTCHADGGPVSTLPEGGWNGSCAACHASIHPDYDAEHIAYGQDCAGCHGDPADAREFHRTCGASPAGGWTPNTEVLPCHTGPDYVPTPRLGPPYTNGYWCRTCHPDE